MWVSTHDSGIVVEVVEPAPAEDRLSLRDARADARLIAHVELDEVQLGATRGLEGLQLRGGVRVPDGGDDEVVRCSDELVDELETEPARCAARVCNQSRSCLGASSAGEDEHPPSDEPSRDVCHCCCACVRVCRADRGVVDRCRRRGDYGSRFAIRGSIYLLLILMDPP